MQRARRLLKACRILNNTPTSIISHMSCIVVYIIVCICILLNIAGIFFQDPKFTNDRQNLSYLSVVVVLLTIRSIYTGFFEDKRQGTKNSLKALTVHLPINKRDYIMAQYIGNLYLFIPAYIMVAFFEISNSINQQEVMYQFLYGMIIIGFNITYCLISLEKGMLNYYYVDPRFREAAYLCLTFLWMWINYLVESSGIDTIVNALLVGKENELWFMIVCKLGQAWGLILVAVALFMGYLCSAKLPVRLERRK